MYSIKQTIEPRVYLVGNGMDANNTHTHQRIKAFFSLFQLLISYDEQYISVQ